MGSRGGAVDLGVYAKNRRQLEQAQAEVSFLKAQVLVLAEDKAVGMFEAQESDEGAHSLDEIREAVLIESAKRAVGVLTGEEVPS